MEIFCVVRNCHLWDSIGDGIDVDEGTGMLVDGCVIEGCLGAGIIMSGDSIYGGKVTNCRVNNCCLERRSARFGGIVLRGSSFIFTNAMVVNTLQPVDLTSVKAAEQDDILAKVIISNCYFHSFSGTEDDIRVVRSQGDGAVIMSNCDLFKTFEEGYDGNNGFTLFSGSSQQSIIKL